MNRESNGNNKYSGNSFTTKGLGILLVFSFIVTVLAFATAYNEHRQIEILSQKYDEAIVKISDCEEVLEALVQQIANSSYAEATAKPEQEIAATAPLETTVTSVEETAYRSANETSTTKPQTTQSKTEETKTTASTPSTSVPYFVTQSGEKYHVDSCKYLEKSKIEITWDIIKAKGYTPCSRCIK